MDESPERQTWPKGNPPKPPKIEKTCSLPGCEVKFFVRSLNRDERFCSSAHRVEYHRVAEQLGDRILRGYMAVSGKSQKACVLEALSSGKWIALGRMFPYVNLNCVSKLRKKGHDIRCRIVFRDDIMRRQAEYRLVAPAMNGETNGV